MSKRAENSKIQGLLDIVGRSSKAAQIKNRRLTRLQQIVLGLISADFHHALRNASTSELNAKDADGNTVLSWAARCADEVATRSLLERGADMSPTSRFGSTALHYAASARLPRCIVPLLEAGANPNMLNACLLETPLHVAALRHDEPQNFLMPLLSYGADVNARDHEGSSVLAFAVQAGHGYSAEYLLAYGADVNSPDEGGLTPLGLAIVYKKCKVIRTLLAYGANDTDVTEAGETLLHLCALHGDLKTLGVLAQQKVKVCDAALDAQGMRAMDYARLRSDEFAEAFGHFIEMMRTLHQTEH